jgi:hypothetical protein
MVGASVRRRQVAYGCGRGLSIRRACALMSVARSTLRYESRLAKLDAPVMAVMRELAAQYPRYGYRRIQVFLARRRHVMSADRTHRLWRLHGLQSAEKEATTACGGASPPASGTLRSEPGLGIRLPVRRLCQWPAAEVPDGDR